MSAGHTTIITPIKDGQAEALKSYLRSNVEPRFHPTAILKCNEFPFDMISGLHFCSFTVLDEDGEFGPSLVFEATFDGSRNFFLDALLLFALEPMDRIYQHCEGYPVSGPAAPALIRDYLAANDVRAQILFRGSPGRTVAEIKGEANIYDALVAFVCDRWRSPKVMPSTFAGFQQELQQNVISSQPANRWAEQMAAVPWEVARRGLAVVAAGLALVFVACGIGMLVLALLGWSVSDVYNNGPTAVGRLIRWIFAHTRLDWVNELSSLPGLLVALMIVRLAELVLQYNDEPRAKIMGKSFWRRYLVHLLIILRYALMVAFVGFALLLIDPKSKLDPEFTKWLQESFYTVPYPSLLLVGAFIIFALFQYRVTSLKLAVQFQELEAWQENRRRLEIDMLRFGMVLDAVFALFVIGRYLPDRMNLWLAENVLPLLKILLVFAAYIFVGLIVFYVIAFALFVVVRIKELADRRHFVSAETLAAGADPHIYEREEGGINTYQNHLASLTYVKPGFLRKWFLRLTLFVIGLLSRFWFNIGELGGIPTILSARWVLIDGGRRLLFLDHYGGAWDSYLNEFIDMSAVTGLNAIWTNTFVKAGGRKVAFPETEFYLWKGAQVERPFKAYVRQSQIETIAWYSAYPVPATVTINSITKLRQSLFKSLASSEVDSLIQNL